MGVLKNLFLLSVAATPAVGDGLNARAQAIGKYMGTQYNVGYMDDEEFMSIANDADEFGSFVSGNHLKWDYTEPSQNSFRYTNGDTVASNGLGAGQMMRCHTLVWHSQLPSWVSDGGFDNATLISVMENHITNVVTHYKGQCTHWDVVNEALNSDGSYRESVFYTTIGEAYIPIAFRAAAAADPDAKLYYNDYNIELAGSKSDGARGIVSLVQSYGAKIDGVGLQGHFIVGSVSSASSYMSNMQAYIDLDVDVAYTEVDIRMTLPSDSDKLSQQAADYGDVVSSCAQTPRCVGLTIWGFTDKYSWIPDVFDGYGDALLWDDEFNKKAAYTAALDAWGSAPTATGTTTATTATGTGTGTTASPTSTGDSCSSQWEQCGGVGWSGPTCCVSGTTCQYQNEWYSQCL